MSAHRDPEMVADYSKNASMRGLRVIIAGAGLAAALPGVVAAHTDLPVIGVPLSSSNSIGGGLDALLAIAQMPPGVPVASWHKRREERGRDGCENPRRLIERYTRPEMGAVWSEQRKLDTWLQVELAAIDGLEELTVVPSDDAATIRDRASFTVDAVKEREKVTDHDVAAFVDVVAESVGEAGRWVHHGLTSSDVLDTALALQLTAAGLILIGGAVDYRDALMRQARAHRGTLCVGRTHGVHAEPTTFGVKLAGFAFEAQRNLRRLERAVEQVSVGALSGAVGTYATNGPEFERVVLQRLGLAREGVSDPGGGARSPRRVLVSDRDRGRRPRALRHRDPPPPAHRGARGRGAVPGRPEGLVRDARTSATRSSPSASPASPGSCAATRRPASRTWRSGTSATSPTPPSSASRCPTRRSCSTTRSTWPSGSCDGMVVHPDRMRANLNATHGALYSQRALLALVESGRSRDDAYRIVQEKRPARVRRGDLVPRPAGHRGAGVGSGRGVPGRPSHRRCHRLMGGPEASMARGWISTPPAPPPGGSAVSEGSKLRCRPAPKRKARKSSVDHPLAQDASSRRRKRSKARCRPVKHHRKPRKKTPPKKSPPVNARPPVRTPPPAQPPPKPPVAPPPTAPPVTTPLGAYTGPFGVRQAERLLWRAGFGPSPGHAELLAAMGLQAAVASLTRPAGAAVLTGSEPTDDDGNPLAPEDVWGHDHLWWLDRMVRTNQPLVERMTLIWHDWFATSLDGVGQQNLMLDQNELFRRSAFGSFDRLLHDVTQDPAMILWLNLAENSRWSPNENYAREVMELFTLGADRGAYTEDDVRELARALTGLPLRLELPAAGAHNFRMDPARHDPGVKTIFGSQGAYAWDEAVGKVRAPTRCTPPYFVNKALRSYFIPTPPPREPASTSWRASTCRAAGRCAP